MMKKVAPKIMIDIDNDIIKSETSDEEEIQNIISDFNIRINEKNSVF